jgi:pyruvate kinase
VASKPRPQGREPAGHRDPVSASAQGCSDLDPALDAGIDWIGLSFVQRPEDLAEVKKIARGRAAVMAKI